MRQATSTAIQHARTRQALRHTQACGMHARSTIHTEMGMQTHCFCLRPSSSADSQTMPPRAQFTTASATGTEGTHRAHSHSLHRAALAIATRHAMGTAVAERTTGAKNALGTA
jgi:hypothetical protein